MIKVVNQQQTIKENTTYLQNKKGKLTLIIKIRTDENQLKATKDYVM